MKKSKGSTIILILIFLAGVSLLLYPTVSDYWNALHQSRAIAQYAEEAARLDTEKQERLWKQAKDYNEELRKKANRYVMSEAERKEYESLLNIAGTGIIGYIEIPKIHCALPIYHGTDEAVLQIAAGHIAGTSLPAGGAGTHTVISGHRGLPSAKLFTDLDKMAEGDTFLIRVLDETLTYAVDQILIVLPHEMEALEIEEGADYCTLVTCTPYGVNTHRLLVRGHRIENTPDANGVRVTADAMQIEPVVAAPFVAAPILLLLLVLLVIRTRKKNKEEMDR